MFNPTLEAIKKLKEDLQAEWPSISLITALDSIDSAISLTLKAAREIMVEGKPTGWRDRRLAALDSLSQQLSGK